MTRTTRIQAVFGGLSILLAAITAAEGKELALRDLRFVTKQMTATPANSFATCRQACERLAGCASFSFRARSCTMHRAGARLWRTKGALSGYRAVARCARDADCSDAKFCNGVERCRPRTHGADRRGCVAGTPPCRSDQQCNEARHQCATSCATPDRDGDGHKSIACGGDDCDDNDANRYPGNPEQCDAEGRDEDCNPCTVAGPADGDRDGDGHVSATCRNHAGGTSCSGVKLAFDRRRNMRMGTDCDDSNPAIGPGSQVCEGASNVKVCGAAGWHPRSQGRLAPAGGWRIESCPGSGDRRGSCVPQPNGTGVCVR